MVKIILDLENNRAVATQNGVEIGECVYIKEEKCINIIHTQVDSAYQGQGIARELVNKVIEYAIKEKYEIIADCSYAKKVIENSNR